ncbi:cyclic AMP response element-binding protein A-like isoform X2 [Limulus polyphemus]|uniref:Cyclic AMP response element-binding protein A-like isoform X2 n=1 Tax=Limulus polyphemus TaxID=6850 RepID=A0ABM1SPP6_LIMPO|nr:cyclic AMP response element-binding protein A-like isoform X2 [Limulus polyphemus]
MALDIIDGIFYNFEENYLNDIWNTDPAEPLQCMDLDLDMDCKNILDNRSIILHDRMMTDAVQSPFVQADHCYSLAIDDNIPDSPLSKQPPDNQMEDYSEDMVAECFPAIPLTSASGEAEFTGFNAVKQEPLSSPPSPSTELLPCTSSDNKTQSTASVQHNSLVTHPESNTKGAKRRRLLMPNINIKLENAGFPLPPTPPSSTNSDTDGSLSPFHPLSTPSPPPAVIVSSSLNYSTANRKGFSSSPILVKSSTSTSKGLYYSSLLSNQPKGATGALVLTEEEKRTLLAEGYPIPHRLPLTKAEERSLKKVRRKIKNKISAQESRRKRKEYVDTLEKNVEILTNENNDFKKKVESLENINKSLQSELQKLLSLLDSSCLKKDKIATSHKVAEPLIDSPVESLDDTLDFFENYEDKAR